MNHNSFTLGVSLRRLQRFRNTIQACQLLLDQISMKVTEMKSVPVIRRATYQDNGSISNFIRNHYRSHDSETSEVLRSDEELTNMNTAYGEKDAFLGVMNLREELVGTVGFKRFDQQSCELKTFHLKSGYSNRKNSRTLLNFALDEAKALNYLGCLVRIFPGESELLRFLMNEGFEYEISEDKSSVKTLIKVF